MPFLGRNHGLRESIRIEVQRLDPDELLARLKEEEQQQTRGKLKIFLG